MLAYWARRASFLFLDSSDTSLDFTTIWACFSIMLAMAWTSAAVRKCKTKQWPSVPWLAVKVHYLFINIVLAVSAQVCVLATNVTECTSLRDDMHRVNNLFPVIKGEQSEKTTLSGINIFSYHKKKTFCSFRNCFALLFQELTPRDKTVTHSAPKLRNKQFHNVCVCVWVVQDSWQAVFFFFCLI